MLFSLLQYEVPVASVIKSKCIDIGATELDEISLEAVFSLLLTACNKLDAHRQLISI